MKRIHILQHEPYETPGCIENWIKDKSYLCTVTELFSNGTFPDISAIDWVIVMGGSMSVHDTGVFPWLVREKRFIKEAIDSGKVVLGICLGSQLIAEVLGAGVYKNSKKEIGWFPVVRSTGTNSTLLKNFQNTETVFHWHGDTFNIPDDASAEFSSEGCRNQSFVYNEKVLGLQFHVEVTDQLLQGMLANGSEELIPGDFIQSPNQLREGASNIKRNNELMYSILDELDKL